jgi:hypothetical protein
MTRLCIVARGEFMLYGYLMVALEHDLEGPNRMEFMFDRRRPAPPSGGAPPDVERRTHSAVDEVLRTQGYVILDENGNLAAPERLRTSRGTVLLWQSAAEWAGERARSAWQARPATGNVVKVTGVLAALASSAVFMAAQFPTRADRWVVMRGAESRMASPPTHTTEVASPPTVASPAALVVAPPTAGPLTLAVSTPAPAVPASPLAARPPAPGQPLMRRTPVAAPRNPTPAPPSARSRGAALRPAAAPVTTPARKSAPPSAKPTVVLETEPQGKGNQRSITYTASVLDASGRPLTNAKVSLLAWMPDGSDLEASLGSTDTPGTYRGSVYVGVFTPGNLRVRIAHGETSFDIAPQRRRH